MQGPITVFDGGVYAGDARIEDLAPGQERLISYAIDLKTEVEPLAEAGQQELVAVSLRRGTLLATRKLSEEKTYNVKNRDQKKKAVLIEHPFRSDWQLSKPGEPSERTRDVYRFALTVDAGERAQLQVHEEKQIQQTVRLMDSGPDLIAAYLQARQISPRVKEALQQVIALRDRLDQTTNQRSRLEQRVQEITQEQDRIRRNMGQLAQNSELYQRYVRKLDQQETEMEKLRQEIETLKETEVRQKRELDDYLLGLDIG
jgi:myosin heavy subunit